MAEYSRALKRIIDYGSGGDHKRPMYISSTTIKDLSKEMVPESAKWHMRHIPYQKSICKRKDQQIIAGSEIRVSNQESMIHHNSEQHQKGGDKNGQGNK